MEKKLNGREIKNIVRVGHSLSRNEKRDMETADLIQGLDLLEQFETDFGRWSAQGKDKDVKPLENGAWGSSDR